MAEAVRQDVESGLLSPGQTVEALLRQDVRCPLREEGASCLLAGGEGCAAVGRGRGAGSLLGGKRLAPPPCQGACPAGVDLAGILQLLREGSLLEAQRTLMKYLPMAHTVCRACGRCAGACVREEPVGLPQLMDWLGGTIDQHPEIFFIPPFGGQPEVGGPCRPLPWRACPPPITCGAWATTWWSSETALPRRTLAPFGERAASLAGRLSRYKENLAAMGVQFAQGGLDSWEGPAFHQVVDLEGAPKQGWDQLVPAIHWGGGGSPETEPALRPEILFRAGGAISAPSSGRAFPGFLPRRSRTCPRPWPRRAAASTAPATEPAAAGPAPPC